MTEMDLSIYNENVSVAASADQNVRRPAFAGRKILPRGVLPLV